MKVISTNGVTEVPLGQLGSLQALTIEADITPLDMSNQDLVSLVPIETTGGQRVTIHLPWDGAIHWQWGVQAPMVPFDPDWVGQRAKYVFTARTGGDISIYRNGTLLASASGAVPFKPYDALFRIGGRPTSPFTGLIHQIDIYDTERIPDSLLVTILKWGGLAVAGAMVLKALKK